MKNTRLLHLEMVNLDLSSELSSQCTNACGCSVSYRLRVSCSISKRMILILCKCMCLGALLGLQYPSKFTGILIFLDKSEEHKDFLQVLSHSKIHIARREEGVC